MTVKQKVIVAQGDFIDDKDKYPSVIFMNKETWTQHIWETNTPSKSKRHIMKVPVMLSEDLKTGEILIQ